MGAAREKAAEITRGYIAEDNRFHDAVALWSRVFVNVCIISLLLGIIGFAAWQIGWVIAGLVLAVGNLALNIHMGRRLKQHQCILKGKRGQE